MEMKQIITYGKIAGIIIAALIFLTLLMDYIAFPLYVRHGRELELPDVTEQTFDEAKRLLDSKGFVVVKDDEKYDPHHQEGIVLQQNPLPFSTVKKGRRVYLVISAGERQAVVPDLTKSSEREAILKISAAQLSLGEKLYEYSSFFPLGVVFKQSQYSGTKVKKETKIDITISLGAEPNEIIVPDVVGTILERAEETIKKTGLAIGEITFSVNNDLLPNTVLFQSIASGNVANISDTVSLIISRIDTTINQ